MGYSCNFLIKKERGRKNEFEKLVDILKKKAQPPMFTDPEPDDDSVVFPDTHWYDQDEDCLETSKLFPGVVFSVERAGEIPTDDHEITFYDYGTSVKYDLTETDLPTVENAWELMSPRDETKFGLTDRQLRTVQRIQRAMDAAKKEQVGFAFIRFKGMPYYAAFSLLKLEQHSLEDNEETARAIIEHGKLLKI